MKPGRFSFRYACLVTLLVANYAVAADTSKTYLEKQVGDQIVRLPILSGFSPACEESAEFAARAMKTTPSTHHLLTCEVDSIKWEMTKTGKSLPYLYPAIVVTAIRHQGGGFTREEFTKMEAVVRARFPNMITTDPKRPDSKAPRAAVTVDGSSTIAENYQQQLQGFLDVKSKAPSFAFQTQRTYDVTSDTKTAQFREATVILVVFYNAEVLQMMAIDDAGPNGDTSRIRNATQRWLDAFESLNSVR